MRVTENLIFSQGNAGIAAARLNEEQATAQTSSGVRVAHPGDDPAAAGQLVLHRLAAKRADAIQTSLGRASDELGTVDGALDGLANVVTRARELTVQLSNDSYSANERTAAATEVQGLFQSALGLLNTRVGNRYVFGGNADGAPPFDAAGAYQGDAGVRQVEIAPGVLQDASIRADVLAKGAGGGVDLFATLTSLQTALSTNNVAGVRGALDGLDAGVTQIASGRAQTGTAMNVIDGATAAAATAVTSEKTTISHLADADIFESAAKLAQAQQALDAALTATAKSFGLTLLDKLR